MTVDGSNTPRDRGRGRSVCASVSQHIGHFRLRRLHRRCGARRDCFSGESIRDDARASLGRRAREGPPLGKGQSARAETNNRCARAAIFCWCPEAEGLVACCRESSWGAESQAERRVGITREKGREEGEDIGRPSRSAGSVRGSFRSASEGSAADPRADQSVADRGLQPSLVLERV